MRQDNQYFDRGAQIDGRFEVIEPLGEGGFGVVYKARQLSTQQEVAVKVLIPERIPNREEAALASQRFEREMTLLGQLNHPNAVRLIDFGELDEGRLYMVLEYVEGVDLKTILRDEGSLTPEETRQLMMQVLDVLSVAHDLGIVHRDLKPANLMVTSSGAQRNAKVLDFGISSIMKDSRSADYKELTAVGSIPGTPSYMAPEQLEDTGLTPQSDIYSWGLVFLECMTGRVVIDAPSLAGIVFKQVSPHPVPIPEVVAHHPLGEVVARAVSKRLDKRFESAREAFRWLKACDCRDLLLPWQQQSPPVDDETVRGRIPPIASNDQPVIPSSVLLDHYDEADPHAHTEDAPSRRLLAGAAVVESTERSGEWMEEEAAVAARHRRLFVISAGVVVIAGLLLVLLLRGQSGSKDAVAGDDPKPPPAAGSGTESAPSVEADAMSTAMLATTPVESTPPAPLEPAPEVIEPALPEVVRVGRATVMLGLDAEGLERAMAQSATFASAEERDVLGMELYEGVALLASERWNREPLDVMRAEMTWKTWEAHRERVSGLESVCPGGIPESGPAAQPVTGISPKEAEVFCQGLGMRLPTTREWEAIARGEEDRWMAFEGADDPTRIATLQRSAIHARDAEWGSVEGVFALSSGVSEWVTCDVKVSYCKTYGHRGGAWSTSPMWWQTFLMGRLPDAGEMACVRDHSIGFRCVDDP